MKKLSLSILLAGLFNLVYAGGVIEPTEPAMDTAADVNKSVGNKDRSLYMPRLITPDALKSGVYGGMGLALSSLSADTSPSIFSSKKGNNRMIDISILAGYNFNKYIAAESRAMLSIGDDNGVDYKSLSLFLKPHYDVYKGVDVYSLIGVGKVKARDVFDNKLKASKTSMQLGIGADYKLKDNFKVFADYTYLGKDSHGKYNNNPAVLKSSAITTGLSYDF